MARAAGERSKEIHASIVIDPESINECTEKPRRIKNNNHPNTTRVFVTLSLIVYS